MGSTVSQYENAVKLSVSFDAPETTTLVLQGPALAAYHQWMESGAVEDHEYFMDKLYEQLEDHIAQWTMIRDWDYAPGSGR
jgi:hypothetical protein